jgi:hypothetical protein
MIVQNSIYNELILPFLLLFFNTVMDVLLTL